MSSKQQKSGALTACCIGRHVAAASDEHVIPYVLGGKLTLDRVCHDCNNGPCSALDAYLSTSYLIPTRRVQFRTPRSEEAEKIIYGEVLMDGEYPGVLHSDLRGNMRFMQHGREPIVEFDEQGRKHVSLRLASAEPREVLRVAKRVAAREGLPEPTLEQISERIRSAPEPPASRQIQFTKNIDLSRLAIAGAKIAYEFAVYALGDNYLNDEGAESFRDIILEGFDAIERFAAGEDVVTHGFTWPRGFTPRSRFDADLPPSAHAIVLAMEGETLRVRFRLFDVYEGSYAMSPNGRRLFEAGASRLYYIDVANGLVIDDIFEHTN